MHTTLKMGGHSSTDQYKFDRHCVQFTEHLTPGVGGGVAYLHFESFKSLDIAARVLADIRDEWLAEISSAHMHYRDVLADDPDESQDHDPNEGDRLGIEVDAEWQAVSR